MTSTAEHGEKPCSFGKEMREKEFLLRPGSTFINHGSYGTVPRKVFEERIRLLQEQESHPDDWFRKQSFRKWMGARDAAADFLNANPDDLVFVENATEGINTVLKSYPYQPGDAIMTSSLVYPAVKETCLHTCGRVQDIQILFLEIALPITSEDEVVEKYSQFLEKHPNIRIAVLEYIASPTPVVMPLKRLIEVCHQHNVICAIDGAHTPGQLPLNLQELGADFFTGNFHKWTFTPRGCAILWASPKHRKWLTPLVTSSNNDLGFNLEFSYHGTRDDTPYYCVPEALKVYKSFGGMSAITAYNRSLIEKAASKLVSSWGTRTLPVPKSMEPPFLRGVQLPNIPGYDKSEKDASRIQLHLYKEYDIQTAVVFLQGENYLRLSAHVYNTDDDYDKVDKAITEMTSHNES